MDFAHPRYGGTPLVALAVPSKTRRDRAKIDSPPADPLSHCPRKESLLLPVKCCGSTILEGNLPFFVSCYFPSDICPCLCRLIRKRSSGFPHDVRLKPTKHRVPSKKGTHPFVVNSRFLMLREGSKAFHPYGSQIRSGSDLFTCWFFSVAQRTQK